MALSWEPAVIYDNAMAAYWNSQTYLPGTTKTGLSANLVQGSILTLVFSRTLEAGLDEDEAMFSFHLSVEAGPGAPMSSVSDTQAVAIEGLLGTTIGNLIGPHLTTHWSLKEYRWRHFGADFPLDKNGFSKPGPAWRITPITTPGSAVTPALADQLACSVTYRTASRKHWGRNYWGGLTTAVFVNEVAGRFQDSFVDAVATSFHGFVDGLTTLPAITNLVVWSPRYRGALTITELSVDDVPDVIRRRRAKHPVHRKTFTD